MNLLRLISKATIFLAISLSSLSGVAFGVAATKITSLSVTADEVLMDIKSGNPEKRDCRIDIIGLSPLARDPQYSSVWKSAEKFPISSSSAEQIFVAKPDLVIATSFNSPELVAQLRHLKIRVEVLGNLNSIAEIKDSIRLIGKWINCQIATEGLVRILDEKLGAPPAQAPSTPGVLPWNENLVLPGRGTIFEDMVAAAGLRNSLAELNFTGWAPVNAERLAKLNPDWIIISSAGDGQQRKTLLEHACCRKMRAVATDQIIVLPERLFSSASHYIGDAVQLLKKSAKQSPQFKSNPALGAPP